MQKIGSRTTSAQRRATQASDCPLRDILRQAQDERKTAMVDASVFLAGAAGSGSADPQAQWPPRGAGSYTQ